jgi:hypothetical protein
MSQADNNEKFIMLRKQYPCFVFENYHIDKRPEALKISFEFSLSGKFIFKPELIFPIRSEKIRKRLSEIDIRNLVFNMGMIELISYWKASCSPKIIIKPHSLNPEQIAWWKKLYFNGLGEFFYLNSIKTDIETFVDIEIDSGSKLTAQRFNLDDKLIVPVGGGKDSIVSLEILKEGNLAVTPLVLNINASRERTIVQAGFDHTNIIEISRNIDPTLLELNAQGFLNGHTPFSSALAFTSLLAAVINGNKHIALSNESSANESTVNNSNINHQYSKSHEFESDFRAYISKYISPDLNYFSFLRPLNELQIAKLFSEYSSYFLKFRSCNVGSKTDDWCGKCPKCLFTFIILSPFINENNLIKIFSKNLLDDIELKSVFDELIGIGATKPFECVGTLEDVNAAIALRMKNHQHRKLPALLKYYLKTNPEKLNKNLDPKRLLSKLNTEHFLNPSLFKLIKAKI